MGYCAQYEWMQMEVAVATLYEYGSPQTDISTTESSRSRVSWFSPSRSEPMTRTVLWGNWNSASGVEFVVCSRPTSLYPSSLSFLRMGSSER